MKRKNRYNTHHSNTTPTPEQHQSNVRATPQELHSITRRHVSNHPASHSPRSPYSPYLPLYLPPTTPPSPYSYPVDSLLPSFITLRLSTIPASLCLASPRLASPYLPVRHFSSPLTIPSATQPSPQLPRDLSCHSVSLPHSQQAAKPVRQQASKPASHHARQTPRHHVYQEIWFSVTLRPVPSQFTVKPLKPKPVKPPQKLVTQSLLPGRSVNTHRNEPYEALAQPLMNRHSSMHNPTFQEPHTSYYLTLAYQNLAPFTPRHEDIRNHHLPIPHSSITFYHGLPSARPPSHLSISHPAVPGPPTPAVAMGRQAGEVTAGCLYTNIPSPQDSLQQVPPNTPPTSPPTSPPAHQHQQPPVPIPQSHKAFTANSKQNLSQSSQPGSPSIPQGPVEVGERLPGWCGSLVLRGLWLCGESLSCYYWNHENTLENPNDLQQSLFTVTGGCIF
ncbi:leucine-rich repeat extensin-like protein 5 [Portunus trituberculatus]|uniref:leucine-rich repeat extensin-like protein 5 n=1 Tax=Portunus trituberculatus TaxID=210409 RepID=UPI001E1CE447|nr:leucine-rich repeat extensin-like protein 5 [Portunus trituberculatus]